MKRNEIYLTIIIPTLNEDESIYDVIKSIPSEISRRSEILVIDGKSKDSTVAEAKRAGSTVIIEPRKGKGTAMMRGIKEAKTGLCLFMDGDGSMNPDDIPKFLSAIKESDLVLGSRFIEKVDGRTHVVGNSFMNLFSSILFLRRITDINSGFKLIKTDVAKKLNLHSSGFEIEAEILLKAITRGYKYREIPIDSRERVYGSAKLSALRDGYRIIREIVKIRLGL